MIVSGVVTQDEAFYSHEFGVDYNVVFLLIGMMVIVNIVRDTGLFEVLAIWSAQRAGAHPVRTAGVACPCHRRAVGHARQCDDGAS